MSVEDVCDVETSARILGVDLEVAKDLCAVANGDPRRLSSKDLLEMARILHEDSEEDEERVLCESCGKEDDEGVADDTWIMFGTGNDRSPVFVFVCPDCEKSEEKMKKAFNIFVSALNLKRLS